MRWTKDNIDCGTIVAKQWSNNERFYTPLMIGYHNIAGGDQVVGLISLRDGAFIQYGTLEELADKLNQGHYTPAIKMMCERGYDVDVLENRVGVPVVLITNRKD